jgi:hypothetical protein
MTVSIVPYDLAFRTLLSREPGRPGLRRPTTPR